MKIITVPRISSPPDLSSGETHGIRKAYLFLLTQLASKDRGCLVGFWNTESGLGLWKLSEENGLIFGLPSTGTLDLQGKEKSVFRSILARLGNALVDETYLGAGTFQVSLRRRAPDHEAIRLDVFKHRTKRFWSQNSNLRCVGDFLSLGPELSG
jgi:hypothetical protein